MNQISPNKIIFTDLSGEVSEEYYPIPATDLIPEWYKKLPTYINSDKPIDLQDGAFLNPSTVKRCLPFFDAMTAGYFILTPVDIAVEFRDGRQYYKWMSLDMISFHGGAQLSTHPAIKDFDYLPKFNNPWAVKTPKGYSSLYIPPMSRGETLFEIMPGVVDTDTYSMQTNFVFIMNDKTWSGIIPAGTPVAQVIPFKRDPWKMIIGGKKEIEESNKKKNSLHSTFFNGYRNKFWNRKSYK